MSKVIDLIGNKYGFLTVIARGQNTKSGQTKWICKCKCGNTKEIRGGDLKNGKTTSCGCMINSKRKENLLGKRFGNLTVIKEAENRNNRTHWLCQCDCGKQKIIASSALKSNLTISCGCSKKGNNKHNGTRTRLYRIWCGMKDRCFNVNNPRYSSYGNRGITVCDEWKDDFVAFKLWSIKNGYQDDLSIDRIDNNGNYEPSNCRWATDIQQANNKRNNHLVTINNETHTLAEWERISGVSYGTILVRIKSGKQGVELIS